MNFGEKEPIQLLDKLRLVCQCRGLFGPSLFRTSGMGCVVLLPDNLQYRTWSNILFCYAVAMRASAEAASILQFFWDSEMNWGVRKKNTLHIWPQFLNFNARTHFYMKLVLIRFFYRWMIAIPQFRILIYSCERAFYSRQPRDFYMGA